MSDNYNAGDDLTVVAGFPFHPKIDACGRYRPRQQGTAPNHEGTETMSERPIAFTGQRRDRTTRRSVLVTNALAHVLITIGGIGTIIAVLGVCIFLVYVVIPVFLPGSTASSQAMKLSRATADAETDFGEIRYFGVDEYLTTGWIMDRKARIRSVSLKTGQILSEFDPFPDQPPTSVSLNTSGDTATFGFADGSVRIGHLGFETRFLESDEVSDDLKDLEEGAFATVGESTVEKTPEGQFRLQSIRFEVDDPLEGGADSEVVLASMVDTPRGPVFATLSKDQELRINTVREIRNLMTGKVTRRVNSAAVPYQPREDGTPPSELLLPGLGDNIFLLWPDGYLQRYDVRNVRESALAEEVYVLDDPPPDSSGTPRVTSVNWLLGNRTLLIGDNFGRVGAWFRIKPEDAKTIDQIRFVKGHEIDRHEAEVTSLSTSRRTRMSVIGYADGHIRIVYITNQKRVVDVDLPSGSAIRSAIISPKEDSILALGESEVARWGFDPGHPEVTLASLFLPVWYEESPEPKHVWQSSAGTDEFEPKLGLVPLVFGTLKATLFSMLFGVPVALLAAIYTSEFLHRRTRAKVKPVIELMASLPSVVLGYLAAIIFAPFVETVVPAALCAFFTVPMTFLLGAYGFQLLPYRFWLRWSRFRFLLMMIALPAGVILAFLIGPAVEAFLFEGNVRIWLSGQIGNGTGAWVMILLPICALLAAVINSRFVNVRFQRAASKWDRSKCALGDLVKFLIGAALTVIIVLLFASALNGIGFDPRGSVVGTYVQRNAFVVGFAMGFAIVPIIYTIADDALTSVPEHLRSASLGAGATPWQTAVRIIVPTAMSGLFSACMIGLGRAVGETMIVLMAAGNTPVLDINPFNGMRTLSANIAVELPEAVKDSTHYRTLFLAALVLFVMTFVVNTVAEGVRIRFRKRAFEL